MDKRADAFDDIIRANKYAGNCEMCGKAVRDIPESSFRDDKLYEISPEQEAPDMHSRPVRVCGECSVNPDVYTAIRKNTRGLGWHIGTMKMFLVVPSVKLIQLRRKAVQRRAR